MENKNNNDVSGSFPNPTGHSGKSTQPTSSSSDEMQNRTDKKNSQQQENDSQPDIVIEHDVVIRAQAPIVILFGQPDCGKTMTLIRLARYLAALDYQVSPVETFRPATDTRYRELCRNFNGLLDRSVRAASTKGIDYMLVRVVQNGRTICQILEAPGECYFKTSAPTEEFPVFLRRIIGSACRKIWCFFVVPEWNAQVADNNDLTAPAAYLRKIRTIPMRRQDKAIILFNKIDQTEFLEPNRDMVVHTDAAKRYISEQYVVDKRDIFTGFTRKIFGPITCKKYKFIPFMTGTYPDAAFVPGDDKFPQKLWEAIQGYLRG